MTMTKAKPARKKAAPAAANPEAAAAAPMPVEASIPLAQSEGVSDPAGAVRLADGRTGSRYDFKDMLFCDNPFETIELDGIDGEGVEEDLQGWGSNHGIFRQAIKSLRPVTIVELGTWKGASAIHMAGLCKEYGIAAQILCVDNFIGFPSFYFRKEQAHKEFKIKGGFPRLYWTFMKNVVTAGHQDIITPLVMQTENAVQVCKAKNIKADLIYVDGDHSYAGCKKDLALFDSVLAEDGVFLCDDYQWEGAKQAIDEYIRDTGCMAVIAGNKVLMSKKRDISHVGRIMAELAAKHAQIQERKKKQA
jgi:predicted O-methyltransferase YrrM